MTAAIVVRRPSVSTADPVVRYLARLARGSRSTQLCALGSCAQWVALTRGTPGELLDWATITAGEALTWRAWLVEHRAPATARRCLAALRGVLAEALPVGELAELWRRLPPVRGARVAPGRALERVELGALFRPLGGPLASTRDRRDAALLALLWGLGLRSAEARGVELAAYDVGARTLLVRGKGDRERLLPVGAELAAHLARWLERRGDEPGPLLGGVYETRGAAVVRVLRLDASTVHRIVRRAALRAGLRPVATHDGRRSFASGLLDRGADLATVQALLGHASPVTSARYDRRGERAGREAVERLGLLP